MPDTGTGPRTGTVPGTTPSPSGTDAARRRLAHAQAALLEALVAGAPAPEGFDRDRLRVQARALAAKRASVVAKVAPELPEILGDGYRAAFLSYARGRPMTGGYRLDALLFAEHLLESGAPLPEGVRRRLRRWHRDRSGPVPPLRLRLRLWLGRLRRTAP
ncbi:hypothetical protein GCM10010420_48130 [Streptomyces glaucosporus]|uniref:SCO6045-like C-terminal domain-containing protein n=1 Tax=Streptomyces glaucosporus TaxID=284044 RepID=A0ABP5VZF3_9ACTN